MTIEEEYQKLKSKRGRKSQVDKLRLAELEKLMSEETTESTEEAAEEPAETPSGNGRVIVANLTVPLSGGLKNVPQGTVCDVPEDFLAQMIELGRMEKV